MLQCKKLHSNAKLPTIGHPGEDFGYDLYSVEDVLLLPFQVVSIRTGISATFITDQENLTNNTESHFGLLYKDRSSMALKGITFLGGVIDAGYTNELKVMLINLSNTSYNIHSGDKIVQMLPSPIIANSAQWVNDLPISNRGEKGFGSTGR